MHGPPPPTALPSFLYSHPFLSVGQVRPIGWGPSAAAREGERGTKIKGGGGRGIVRNPIIFSKLIFSTVVQWSAAARQDTHRHNERCAIFLFQIFLPENGRISAWEQCLR